jgi:hypothetical protein
MAVSGYTEAHGAGSQELGFSWKEFDFAWERAGIRGFFGSNKFIDNRISDHLNW